MKKSIVLTILLVVLLSSLFTTTAFAKETGIHTFCNVAIYYSDDGGYIIDEDGERFNINFDIPNESAIFVTYDNNNTVTRRDDKPINYEILNK